MSGLKNDNFLNLIDFDMNQKLKIQNYYPDFAQLIFAGKPMNELLLSGQLLKMQW
jgi:hypothetical protein